MSELKATTAYDAYWKAASNGDTGILVYPKSEADKVIAEKDKEIAELGKYIDELQDKVTNLLLRDRNMAQYFNNAVDALVHNKYKRCLAMAERCYSMSVTMYVKRDTEPVRECKYLYHYRGIWLEKWKRKWLELAEKFKEAK